MTSRIILSIWLMLNAVTSIAQSATAVAPGTIKLKLSPPPQFSDYHMVGRKSLSEHLFINLEGSRHIYDGFAESLTAQVGIGVAIAHNLSLTGGVLAIKESAKNWSNGSNRTGMQLKVNYNVTDQFELSVWGQYISPTTNSSALFPQIKTGTGAGATFRVGKSQIGVTTQYQFDDKQQKWDYESKGKIVMNL